MGRALVSAVRKSISPPIYSADSPQANLEGVGMEHEGYLARGVQRGKPSANNPQRRHVRREDVNRGAISTLRICRP